MTSASTGGGRAGAASRLAIWLAVGLAAGLAAESAAPWSRAAAGSSATVSGGLLALRMGEAMAWPDRVSAVVEVTSGVERPGAGATRPAEQAVGVQLQAFPPDLFAWQPHAGSEVLPGVAWAGLVELDREGPGPRFAYSYDQLPFLEALRVYFAVFRPLPEGSRLALVRSTTFLGRQAVEAVLQEGSGRQAELVVDLATGLVLRAATLGPQPTTLVRAVAIGQTAQLQRVEYEVPPLGPAGRLVVERVGSRWFVTEAVAGDPPHRVRFAQLRFGPEAAARPPDYSRLQLLARLRREGEAHFAARRYPQAVEAYRRLTALDPYQADAFNRLGYAAMQTGDWLTAAAAFDQVIHLNPTSPVGYNNLAYLYAQHEVNLSQALRLAEKALELAGAEPDATVLDTYGWVLVKVGRAQEAVQVLEQALVASGDDPRAQAEILYHLGVAHLQLSRRESARRLFEQALQLQPDLGEVRQALGELGDEGGGSGS